MTQAPHTEENLHNRALARFLQTGTPPDARVGAGLEAVLRAAFPLRSDDRSVALEYVRHALLVPSVHEEDARRLRRSYAATLRVTLRVAIFHGPVTHRAPVAADILNVAEDELSFGELPLLTAEGTWIASGVAQSPLLRLSVSPAGVFSLRAVDALYETTLRGALDKVLDGARTRLQRVMAEGRASRLRPRDLISVAPIQQAWVTMTERGPAREPTLDRTALARAAQVWRVWADDEAVGAFRDATFARWITRDRDGLADLSPDAPLSPDGTLTDGQDDPRPLLTRLAPGLGAQVLRIALPVIAPDPLPVADVTTALRVLREGAALRAPSRGRVASVQARRLWLVDDEAETVTAVALRPRGPEHLDAARVAVKPGDVVEAGDPLVHGAGVHEAQLAPGRWCSVTHDGALAAGSCRVSASAAAALACTEDVTLTVDLSDTPHGVETLSAAPVGVTAHALRHLDASGLATLGAVVETGDVLIARESPAPQGPGAPVSAVATCVYAPAGGVVVSLDVMLRGGTTYCARHAALTAAMYGDLDAETAHDLYGRAAVAAGEKIANVRFTLGDAAKHHGTMADGLVAGHGTGAGERTAWRNRYVSHALHSIRDSFVIVNSKSRSTAGWRARRLTLGFPGRTLALGCG